MTVSCSRLYNVMPTFVAFILAWSTVISYKRRPTLGVINILAGQNLLTTLDTPVVDPKKRDIGRKSRYLPCDAMCKRGLCRHAVSVCLSVCNCREFRTSNRIFKFFYLRIAKPFCSFLTPKSRQNSVGDPTTGASNAGQGRHKSRFWTNSCLSIDDCWTCEQLRRTTVQFIASANL